MKPVSDQMESFHQDGQTITPEQLINKTVAENLNFELTGTGFIVPLLGYTPIEKLRFTGNIAWAYEFIFPEITRLDRWEEFTQHLREIDGFIGIGSYKQGLEDGVSLLARSSPLKICMAFLKSVNAWTSEMGEV